jgi:hypothetical protein
MGGYMTRIGGMRYAYKILFENPEEWRLRTHGKLRVGGVILLKWI